MTRKKTSLEKCQFQELRSALLVHRAQSERHYHHPQATYQNVCIIFEINYLYSPNSFIFLKNIRFLLNEVDSNYFYTRYWWTFYTILVIIYYPDFLEVISSVINYKSTAVFNMRASCILLVFFCCMHSLQYQDFCLKILLI